MASELIQTRVDFAALLSVLGSNLYSTPTVVFRELIQNAHDSIVRRMLEADADFRPSIQIASDRDEGVLEITDTGAGLTRQEIIDYLATIGGGYTRQLRASTRHAELIGQFGLGFLTALVAGERVVVTTTSFQEPDAGWRFVSRGGQTFHVDAVPARPIGTTVAVKLKPEFRGLLEPPELNRVVRRYCSLLHYPIHIGDSRTPINRTPPWRRETVDTAELISFASELEADNEAIAAVPLQATSAEDPQGILWIQGHPRHGDNRSLAVYVRGMLVAENHRDLLPSWASFVSGVIESSVLTPTASREDLVRDASWKTTARTVTQRLVSGLVEIARENGPTWRTVRVRHNQSLRVACVENRELCDAIGEMITVTTSEGELDVASLLRKSGGKVYVSRAPRGGFEEVLCRAMRVPVAVGTLVATVSFLQAQAARLGFQIVELGTADGTRTMFPSRALSSDESRVLAELATKDAQPIPTEFEPASLPMVVVVDREAELERRLAEDEVDLRMSGALRGLARNWTRHLEISTAQRYLYVNLRSPAIQMFLRAPRERRGPAERLFRLMVDLTAGAELASHESFAAALEEMNDVICGLLQPSSVHE